VSRLVWIDVHDLRYSPFLCVKDVNPDFHAYAQYDGSKNQSAMEVDNECLAFGGQRFFHTMSLNLNFQTNPSAPSGFTGNWWCGHTHRPLFPSWQKSKRDLSALAQRLNMREDISVFF
jgi:hypothetical protein